MAGFWLPTITRRTGDLIGLHLHRAGADVVMASDGQEALDRTSEAIARAPSI